MEEKKKKFACKNPEAWNLFGRDNSSECEDLKAVLNHPIAKKRIIKDEFDIFALKKRKFIHNKIEYIFRWAYLRHDTSFQSNKLEKCLLSVYKNENLELFNNNDIILNNCSNFRVKYLKKLSTIEISETLKNKKLILEFDAFNDNLCVFEFLKDFIKVAKNVEIKIKKKIMELKLKYRNEPEMLKKRVTELRKRRHDYVEEYLIKKNRYVIATEIPICDELLYILGHIDILSFYKNKDSIYIGVVDYKPEVENGKSYDFIKTLPQICMYALLLKKKLEFKNIRLFCVSFNSEKGWIYKPDLILKLPDIIKDYYDQRYFNGKLLDIFDNPRDYDFFDWIILSRMYVLHNPISDFFSAIRIEIAKILNLNINSSLDAIALKLIDLKNKLEQDSIFFNKKQKSFLEKFRDSIRYLTDKSIKKEIVFSKFFSHFKFNPNIWKYYLTKRNRLNLEILNKIDKLRILYGREKINRVNYDYYVLSILYNLRDASYSDINFLLAKYYNFYSFNKTYLTALLGALIKKDLIKKLNTGNYVLTNNTKTKLKLLGIKKDPMVFYSRNKYLLKNRDFAFKFLIHLKKYGKYQNLTTLIFEEIRKKIRDINNIIISTRNLRRNVEFLYKYKFLDKHGQISNITHKILEDIQDKDLSESNIKKIKYDKYILQAIYSLVYPRFTYINYYLKHLCKMPEENNYFRFYLDTSINLLLSNDYIKKHGVIYLLSDKGKEYITKNNIKKHKKLRLYGNLKEFDNNCQYGYHILEVLNTYGKSSKKSIASKIRTGDTTGVLNYITLRQNLKKLKKMDYVYSINGESDLTPEGKNLFNISEFANKLQGIEIHDEIIPTFEKIADIQDIFDILQIIFSMEKAPRSYIDYFCKEKSISHHSVNQALDVLCRGKILKIKKRFYILIEKGLDFILNNDIEIDEDIYIRSLVKYFNDYLSNAFIILKYILKNDSISFMDLKKLTKISQTTLDRNLKSLKKMKFLDRKKTKDLVYIYYLTSEGKGICINPRIKKLLNKIE